MISSFRAVSGGPENDPRSDVGIALPSFVWQLASEQFWWSAGMFALYGFAPGEVEPSLDVLLAHQHPDDRGRARQAFEQIQRDGRPFVCEHRLIARTGQVRTVVLSAGTSSDTPGPPTVISGTILDVTDARRVEPVEAIDAPTGLQAELRRLLERTESLSVINRATGVLMERHKIPADEAYALLRRASQLAGRKLTEVASELLFSGILMASDQHRPSFPKPPQPKSRPATHDEGRAQRASGL